MKTSIIVKTGRTETFVIGVANKIRVIKVSVVNGEAEICSSTTLPYSIQDTRALLKLYSEVIDKAEELAAM